MREVPPDVRTNYGDDRRLVVIVMDDANINFKLRNHVKDIGRSIVEQLGPSDQAAVVYTGNNQKSQEFTSNRKLLRAAVERFTEQGVAGNGVQYVVSTIDRAIESLQAIPHRRKAMILVTTVAIDLGGAGDIAYQVRQAMRRAQRANVTIYPVSPAGLEVDISGEAPDGPRDLAADTARTFAEQTGGFATVNRNEFAARRRRLRRLGHRCLLRQLANHRRDRRLRVTLRDEGFDVALRSVLNQRKCYVGVGRRQPWADQSRRRERQTSVAQHFEHGGNAP